MSYIRTLTRSVSHYNGFLWAQNKLLAIGEIGSRALLL